MAKAYNRWLCDKILDADPRIKSMLYLPFHDPEASYEIVKEFADRKGVIGFMVTSTHYKANYDNAYMKTYPRAGRAQPAARLPRRLHLDRSEPAALQPLHRRACAGLHLVQHAAHDQLDHQRHAGALPQAEDALDRERARLDSVPDAAARQRIHDAHVGRGLLKRKPSEYMREMFYTSQPMEMVDNREALELTFKMIKAETQLLYSSDYPHWDMDLPSTIYDLPFLNEQGKRNILGGNAQRLFNLEPVFRR